MATAQQFNPANNYQSNFQQSRFGNWIPPNTTGSVYQNSNSPTARFNAPAIRQPPAVSFPESVAPFETGIRTANFEAPVPDLATGPSITDRIDGAAATFSKWKDMAGEKASSFFSSAKQEGGWLRKIQTFIGTSDVKRMIGSLALVLGLYFAFVWVMRKLNFGGSSGLPSDVVEVLGQVPFGARRSLQLVRLGSKVLLLLNSPEGTQPLGEISDPTEVAHLVSLVQGKRKSRSQLPAAVQQAAQFARGNATLDNAARIGSAATGGALLGNAVAGGAPIGNAALNVAQSVTQSVSQNTSQQKLGNIGATSLNEVIGILQQAAVPGRAVFEA